MVRATEEVKSIPCFRSSNRIDDEIAAGKLANTPPQSGPRTFPNKTAHATTVPTKQTRNKNSAREKVYLGTLRYGNLLKKGIATMKNKTASSNETKILWM